MKYLLTQANNLHTSAFKQKATKTIVGTLGAIAMSISIQAQALENLAITGAEIHTMAGQGIIEEGTVLIENGVITGVTDGVSVPSGYTEIDASGKVLTPGFMGALTSLGLVEVSSSAGVNDSRVDAHPVSTVGAAYDVQYAINNDSTVLDVTRIEGFTSAVTGISGTGQLFNGQGAIISLDKSFDSVLLPQAYMHVDVANAGADRNGESRAALWVSLHQSFDEALVAASVDLSPSNEWHGMISRADAIALNKVLEGDMPLLVSANRAADILQVLKLKARYSALNIVLVGASDGWRVAAQIANAGVAVILSPENNLPGNFDELGATLENAARLHEAGVMIAIGINTHNVRLAAQHAGNAVANGLPHSAGIAALTVNPAIIFGMNEKVGTIERGKRADLVVWSGDPLEVTEAAEVVLINGVVTSMESRQTKLRDRYMNRDPKLPVAYSQ